MRHRIRLSIALLLSSLGLLAAACGGSAGDDEPAPPDVAAVFTATMPNPLPEPIIVGETQGVAVGGTTYTVQPGDSLFTIAQQFGTTVEALIAANDLADPTALDVGQVLVIPSGAPPQEPAVEAPATPTLPAPPPEGENTYVVQSGDVAALIAERFGITIEELAAANNTTIDDLRSLDVGEVLIIPTPRPTPTPETP